MEFFERFWPLFVDFIVVGKKQDHGEIWYKDGSTRRGYWVDDKMHGDFIRMDKKKKKMFKEQWRDNKKMSEYEM